MTTPGCHLVLLRHGQSEWNARNIFTGWVNAGLTEAGGREAARSGRMLAGSGPLPALVHTSLQRRAIQALWWSMRSVRSGSTRRSSRQSKSMNCS